MKKLKKLTLRKEIIAHLSGDEMRGIIGGADYYSGLPLTCMICGTTGQPPKQETQYYNCVPASNNCTRPAGGCCEYGCCHTINC